MSKEARWTRGSHDPERLPRDLQELWQGAVQKMASVRNINLAEKPKRRVMVVECIANLVIQMTPEAINEVLEG